MNCYSVYVCHGVFLKYSKIQCEMKKKLYIVRDTSARDHGFANIC